MKKKVVFILMLLLWIPPSIYALNAAMKKKYPYAMLTDDYGILNKEDMKYSYSDVIKPEPFPSKNAGGQAYWQCYPREHVEVTLTDFGYSSENVADNDGSLFITVHSTPEVSHEFGLRRKWSTEDTQQTFKRWLELMKGQKYVCLAGTSGILTEEKIVNGKNHKNYYWHFERIKTKKGCNSYFASSDCV